MNWRQGTLEMILESLDLYSHDRTFRIGTRFSNNCEWCGRIKCSKICECVLNARARVLRGGLSETEGN